MVREEHSVMIDRPVGEVFAYLTDVTNVPEWQEGVHEIRLEAEAPVSQGTRFTEIRKFLGRRLESKLEVSEHEPDRRFTVRTLSGPVPFTVRHTFEASGQGTRVDVVGEGEPGGFFKIGEALVARQARRMFERDFAKLKAVLEARKS